MYQPKGRFGFQLPCCTVHSQVLFFPVGVCWVFWVFFPSKNHLGWKGFLDYLVQSCSSRITWNRQTRAVGFEYLHSWS